MSSNNFYFFPLKNSSTLFAFDCNMPLFIFSASFIAARVSLLG